MQGERGPCERSEQVAPTRRVGGVFQPGAAWDSTSRSGRNSKVMLDRRRKLPFTDTAIQHARELRGNLTIAEAMLWRGLKRSGMRGYDFHRQKPIGDFIVDFFCPRLMLAIEVDGESHRGKSDYDRRRQEWIEGLGVKVLRLDDALVRRRPQDALSAIEGWIVQEEERDAANRPPPVQ
jgi:very-short-patch-repair endonuclease